MLPHLLNAFREQTAYRRLATHLPDRGESLDVRGLIGSSPAALAAALASDFEQRVLVLISSGPAEAERWLADLEVLLPDRVRLFPQRESLGEEETHYEIAGERVETIAAILSGRCRVIVTTLRATVERTGMPGRVAEQRFELAVGAEMRPGDVISRLEAMGYTREPSVRDVAQFAVRGGLIDVYGYGMASPARMEWWGDEITSVRLFDIDSQRSDREVDRVTVLPVGESDGSIRGGEPVEAARMSLLDLLPVDALLLSLTEDEPSEAERLWREAQHHIDLARRRGEEAPEREELFLDPAAWSSLREGFATIDVLTEEPAEGGNGVSGGIDFRFREPEAVDRDMKRLARVVAAGPTLLLCDNEGQLERLEELLSDPRHPHRGPPANALLALGSLQGGWVMPGLTVLTDHQIFRRARRLRRARRYRQALTAASPELKSGDYVVHLEHGIGIYRSIEVLDLGDDGSIEVAVVEYEGGDRLNVPLYRIDQLERYRAPGDREIPPKLDRLGGTRWARRRKKTESAIRQMAAELLELYARRSVTDGFAFPPDGRWQSELESAFLYEDTPDQVKATVDVKRDLERPRPMDRLVVGDVGYGKTEIAVRAAFKAATAGKQVAVLVPTTILAEQHGTTFQERMADFPLNVEVLSRFKSSAEQKQIIAGLVEGRVDIVIGTHRLLSGDVLFRDLGLLIVDEEHRFGVRHKEHLKQLRLQVDVLTLTATPIPRTLQFALSGLRDLTLIETPPSDRSPVLTFVEPWDDILLEEVIARELDRGGQVFFVHNRIDTISTIAERVCRLAPRAVVAVGHGQMKESELDDVMRAFGAGEVDILVSTMIVESGLDVPNANTMVVDRSDNFGLAQLYQLRGRVGRGHRRAYCYLLVPDNLDPQAEERLRVLEHHTELGSGYRLALRDLELRGAGNLLGSEQSGHAQSVGIDLYMRWLRDAVASLRGEGTERTFPPPDVYFDGAANLPDEYVSDEDAKLDFYRRLARAEDPGEIAGLREELQDRFGPLPDAAERLLTVSELRLLGARLGIESIGVRGDTARINFRTSATPRMATLTAALDSVQFAPEVRRTVPLSLRLTRLGGLGIGPGLVHALSKATGVDSAAHANERGR